MTPKFDGNGDTRWRDARLKQALDSAPDGDARPAEAVREAILRKARLTAAATAAPAAPPRPRRRWWQVLATAGALVFVVLVGVRQPLPPPAAPEAAAPPAPVVVAQAPAAPQQAGEERRLADAGDSARRQSRAQAEAQAQLQRLEQAKQRVIRSTAAPPLRPLVVEPPVIVAEAPPTAAPAAPAAAPPARYAAAAEASAQAPSESWSALLLSSGEGRPVLLPRARLSAAAVQALDRLLAAEAAPGEQRAIRFSEKRAAVRADLLARDRAASEPPPPLRVELVGGPGPARAIELPADEENRQLRLELEAALARRAASAP